MAGRALDEGPPHAGRPENEAGILAPERAQDAHAHLPRRELREGAARARGRAKGVRAIPSDPEGGAPVRDRKSTRLNSSHRTISYAVFCLKKKKTKKNKTET